MSGLKRVPQELSPYSYPRKPGIITACFYHAGQMLIRELSVYLDGTFRIVSREYEAYLGSPETIAGEQTAVDIEQVVSLVTEWICRCEDEGFDTLVYHDTGCPLPVGGGYVVPTLGAVLEAKHDPFTGLLLVALQGPNGPGFIRAGQADGDTELVAKFLDHMKETFGVAPNIAL